MIAAWIAAHHALLLLIWPTLTAVASLVYKTLDTDTRAHAVFSLLASIGIDLPKLWDALGRMLTGGDGKAKPPPAAVLVIVAAVGFSTTACSKPPVVPPNTPTDVGDAVACVIADVTVGKPVDDCVAKYGQVLVADVLQTLLDSKAFADEHPEATAYTRSQLHVHAVKP